MDTSDFVYGVITRDNTTFNTITLTDEGYETGSSGIKVFTGSTRAQQVTDKNTSTNEVENSRF